MASSLIILWEGLAPEAQYPLQLEQAAYALKYLIDTAGYDPQNVRLREIRALSEIADTLLDLCGRGLRWW